MNASSFAGSDAWAYGPALLRLALALGLGLLMGLERERRGKEAGARSFAFAAAAGCAGALLGDAYAITALALLVPFIILINVHSMQRDGKTEITTSAALVVIGFVGVMCGQGHTLPAVALGLTTLALLAWKQPLSGFSVGVTEVEIRSAILLAILAFVIYPVLPAQAVDPWGLIQPRVALTTIILIAGIGFCNYILHKIYGTRGFEAAGFFGGLVNSIVAIIELADRTKVNGSIANVAFKGAMYATAAMAIRNAVLLAIIAPATLYFAGMPMALILLVCLAFALLWRGNGGDASPEPVKLELPFSFVGVLRLGAIFLVVSVMGNLAERWLGGAGFYVVSAVGGIFSSASSVASAGYLVAEGKLSLMSAGIGSVLACLTSTLISIPIIARVGRNATLTRAAVIGIGLVTIVGLAAALAAPDFGTYLQSHVPGP